MLPTPASSAPATQPAPGRQAARRTAIVSGVICLVILLLQIVNHFLGESVDPLKSKELTALKAELARNPRNEEIKQRLRALDLDLRRVYVRHVDRARDGAWLLLGALSVFLLSLKSAAYQKKLPRPPKAILTPETGLRAAARAQRSVAAVAVLLAAAGAGLWLTHRTFLSPQLLASPASKEPLAPTTTTALAPALTPAQAAPAPATPAPPFPTPAEIQRNWPRFRGPGGLGISAYTNVPFAWNGTNGENVLWKTAVPLSNPNSPVVWDNRVFLTGGNSQKLEVYAFDGDTGKLLWQKSPENITRESAEKPTVTEEDGGFAIPTAATDGRRVYAMFANGDVAAFDFAGRQVWARNLGLPDNSYGHASSLELYQDRLLILFDQSDGKDGKSKLLALDSQTGKTVWQTPPRPVPNSWATPILIPNGPQIQIITCGNPWVIAYAPAEGKEIWRAKVLYGEITPSPVFAQGLLFTAVDSEKLSAIRPDGAGDVTDTHVVWKAEDGLPDICSPLCDGERVYLLTGSGLVTTYDAKLGKKLWEHELETTFKASPSLAGDRVYLISDEGIAILLQAGNVFKELGRSPFGEKVWASPAFANGRLYVRGKRNLFCLGQKAK